MVSVFVYRSNKLNNKPTINMFKVIAFVFMLIACACAKPKPDIFYSSPVVTAPLAASVYSPYAYGAYSAYPSYYSAYSPYYASAYSAYASPYIL
ncbi:uncharacterized protein LOC129565045 isoform X2 [Sitodiplosis mosellana]|uniref:uncharacterized protein LOC129565045 isoform X2 n=1 Tax=Sitodiplosis mosellana TaxID=263140 RepID=UPI002444BFE1|nr:uncharacterized protein LOC129565045 isoform X2 [Sitodiplosis mosellana]